MYFVTVFDKSIVKEDGNFIIDNDKIVDWGSYSNNKELDILAKKFAGRWGKKAPVNFVSNKENLVDKIESFFSKKVKKEKFESKGVIFLSTLCPSNFYYMSETEFKSQTGFSKKASEAKDYLAPIPFINYESVHHFGIGRKFFQGKERAIERLIRFNGPTPVYSFSENNSRLFGFKNDNPNSTAYTTLVPASPRSFWTLYIYQMGKNGKIQMEKRDFWLELQKFYGTDDIQKMVLLNSWKKQQDFLKGDLWPLKEDSLSVNAVKFLPKAKGIPLKAK